MMVQVSSWENFNYLAFNRSTFFLIFSLLFVLLACKNYYKNYKEVLSNRIENGDFNRNVLVLEKGDIVTKSAYDLSNIETGDSLQLSSIFRLGSVSKQFTAMAIGILQEDGKLSYEQNIKDIIPELPYDGITIEHLLQHTSGLPDYLNLMVNNWKPELKENDPKRYISGNMDIIQMIVEKTPPIHFDPWWKMGIQQYGLHSLGYSRWKGFGEVLRTIPEWWNFWAVKNEKYLGLFLCKRSGFFHA